MGTFLIFVMAGVQIIAFGWVFGIDRGWREIHLGASIRIPTVFRFIMKYVAPAYLIVVFIGFCVQDLGASIQAAWTTTGSRLAILTIVVTLTLLLAIIRAGAARMRRDGPEDGEAWSPMAREEVA